MFANGIINCNEASSSFGDGIHRLRLYARLLQKKDYCISFTRVRVITTSASHRFDTRVQIENMTFLFTFEPERLPAIMFERDGVHFTLHFSGSLSITGINRPRDVNSVVIRSFSNCARVYKRKRGAETLEYGRYDFRRLS